MKGAGEFRLRGAGLPCSREGEVSPRRHSAEGRLAKGEPMNYSSIKFCDIANGPGVRTSLFVSGCRVHCPGCFNTMTWDFLNGEPFDEAAQRQVLESLAPDYVHGLTLLGGEPMEEENQRALLPFLTLVRQTYPNKTIWCFSGYTLDIICDGPKHCEATDEFLSLIDVLVDGPYIDALHSAGLRFKGSANQRIIDLKATLAARASAAERHEDPAGVDPVLWVDDPVFSTHRMD